MSFVTDDLVFLQNTPFIFYFIGIHKMSFVTDDFWDWNPRPQSLILSLGPREHELL